MAVPTRTQWRAFKQKYNVPDGAVSGVDFGKELDKVHKAMGTKQEAYAAALQSYLPVATKYIAKIDRKKLNNASAFEKEFLAEYVADPNKTLSDFKLAADGKKLYASELRKFLGAVQKLDKNVNFESVQNFSRFARGLSSVALRTKGAVPKDVIDAVNTELARIDTAKTAIKNTSTQQQLDAFVNEARKVGKKVAAIAQAADLHRS